MRIRAFGRPFIYSVEVGGCWPAILTTSILARGLSRATTRCPHPDVLLLGLPPSAEVPDPDSQPAFDRLEAGERELV